MIVNVRSIASTSLCWHCSCYCTFHASARLAIGLPASLYPVAVRMTELLHETDRVVRQANVLCLKRLRPSALLFAAVLAFVATRSLPTSILHWFNAAVSSNSLQAISSTSMNSEWCWSFAFNSLVFSISPRTAFNASPFCISCGSSYHQGPSRMIQSWFLIAEAKQQRHS